MDWWLVDALPACGSWWSDCKCPPPTGGHSGPGVRPHCAGAYVQGSGCPPSVHIITTCYSSSVVFTEYLARLAYRSVDIFGFFFFLWFFSNSCG